MILIGTLKLTEVCVVSFHFHKSPTSCHSLSPATFLHRTTPAPGVRGKAQEPGSWVLLWASLTALLPLTRPWGFAL